MKRKIIPENDRTKTDQPSSEWPILELIEDVHFYKENGFMVLTETYHLARGCCCGNGCRHCPFNHENV